VVQLLEEQMQTDREQGEPSGPRASGPSRQQQVEKLQKKAELIFEMAGREPAQTGCGWQRKTEQYYGQ